MLQTLVVLFLTILLSGCGFGIGLKAGNEVSYSKPAFYLSGDKKGVVGKYNDFSMPWRYSKGVVLRMWGEPDSKTVSSNDQEDWIYHQKDLSWNGPLIGLGMPIPLFIPTRHNYSVLTFSGETLISAKTQDEVFHFCGWFMSDESSGWRCR